MYVHLDNVTAISANDGVVGPGFNMDSNAPMFIGQRPMTLFVPAVLGNDRHGNTRVQEFNMFRVAILCDEVNLKFASIAEGFTGGGVVFPSLGILGQGCMGKMFAVVRRCDGGPRIKDAPPRVVLESGQYDVPALYVFGYLCTPSLDILNFSRTCVISLCLLQ